MQSQKIWLDCDPGHDDMLAIIMAAKCPQCQLIGISTSAGNSNIQQTTKNTLNILEEIQMNHIKVVKGANQPLCCELQNAHQIHGQNGLEGIKLKQSTVSAIIKQPYITIYNLIIQQKQKINFVVTGSMTNLALLLRTFPQIKNKIKRIIFMGGAIGLGNWTPAAEFNIFVDPQAACVVLRQNLPITMIPLQLTHQVIIDENIFTQISQIKSQFSKKLVPLLRYFQKKYYQHQNFEYPIAHDPCTIYNVLSPNHFTGRPAQVTIQLSGQSRGRTNCKFKTNKPNAYICQNMKIANFWHVMLACIKMIK